MNFKLINKTTNETLCTGTKQECMHFIKRHQYNRQEVTVEKADATPIIHRTIPICEENQGEKTSGDIKATQSKGFLKRIYERL